MSSNSVSCSEFALSFSSQICVSWDLFTPKNKNRKGTRRRLNTPFHHTTLAASKDPKPSKSLIFLTALRSGTRLALDSLHPCHQSLRRRPENQQSRHTRSSLFFHPQACGEGSGPESGCPARSSSRIDRVRSMSGSRRRNWRGLLRCDEHPVGETVAVEAPNGLEIAGERLTVTGVQCNDELLRGSFRDFLDLF